MFVDTNVLVRARFEAAPNHLLARQRMQDIGETGEALRISRQVLREYLATVTRPQQWSPPIGMEPALADIATLANAFDILEDGPRVTETLAALCREVRVGGRQIHDANIAATMLAHGERRLLTFNADDFRRFGNRIEMIGLETWAKCDMATAVSLERLDRVRIGRDRRGRRIYVAEPVIAEDLAAIRRCVMFALGLSD